MGYRRRIKPDYQLIAELIKPGTKVLDLGCGDGSMLANLIKEKGVSGIGVDSFPDGLDHCLAKGLAVLQLDLNKGLAGFRNQSFDYVVLNMTLQSIYQPLKLLKEMVRVGKQAIVGFPNFGHWKLIFELLTTQRMPKTKTLPYEWYDTPNIRLLTIKDFRLLCRDCGVEIIKEK